MSGQATKAGSTSGYTINYAQTNASGSSYVNGYTTQITGFSYYRGQWMSWSDGISCTQNITQVQGRARAYGSGGTSSWVYTAAGSPPTVGITITGGAGCF